MSSGKEGVGSPSEGGAGKRRDKIRAHLEQMLQTLTARRAESRRDELSLTLATTTESQGA